MSYTVRVAERAEHDLDAIIAYLLDEFRSPQAAKRVLEDYENLLDSLESMPTSHAFVNDPVPASLGYRWSTVGNYVAYFTIDQDAQVVFIERILYQSQNWQSILLS